MLVTIQATQAPGFSRDCGSSDGHIRRRLHSPVLGTRLAEDNLPSVPQKTGRGHPSCSIVRNKGRHHHNSHKKDPNVGGPFQHVGPVEIMSHLIPGHWFRTRKQTSHSSRGFRGLKVCCRNPALSHLKTPNQHGAPPGDALSSQHSLPGQPRARCWSSETSTL